MLLGRPTATPQEQASIEKKVLHAEKVLLRDVLGFEFWLTQLNRLLFEVNENVTLFSAMLRSGVVVVAEKGEGCGPREKTNEKRWSSAEEFRKQMVDPRVERTFRDVLKTTLVLQFSPERLAVAVVAVTQRGLVAGGHLPDGATDRVGEQEWWEFKGMSTEEVDDVQGQVRELAEVCARGGEG